MTAANGSSDTTPTAPAGDSGAAAAAIQIQPVPATPGVKITRDPAASEPTSARPDRLAIEIRRLDFFIAGLTVVFAFFLGSFTAANNDVWMHLASGREIVNGHYKFWTAEDPFSYATAEVHWDNHSWLYDVIVYALAQAFGGPESPAGAAALVAFKATLLAALAVVMLLIRRPSQGLWVPAACTALAFLAMSPRFHLQPTCVSFLFLGLTLLLLQRPTASATEATTAFGRWWGSTRRWYALPVLFALWVNLDGWFLLGPVVVGLYLLGEVIQDKLFPIHSGPDETVSGNYRQLAIVFAVGLAACLLSPYHVRAFSYPPDLATVLGGEALREESLFDTFFYAPITWEYVTPGTVAIYQNAAACAYVPLLVVALASFALNFRGWRWRRAAVFLPLAVASLCWARMVPFFAIVAGPIMALNFHDYAVHVADEPDSPRLRRWALAGRLATVVGGLALLALAWPGLLHPYADNTDRSRRVGWTIVDPTSFRNAAATLTELRQQGVLGPDSRGFNLSPDVGSYCAWFCPEEKFCFDFRTGLYDDDATQSYVKARQALEHRRAKSAKGTRASSTDAARAETEWQSLFRKKYHADHVVLHGRTLIEASLGLARFWREPQQWTMLYGDGRTFVFGWNDPTRSGPKRFGGHGFDPIPHAYAANLPATDRAPESGAALAAPQDWWEWYSHGPSPRSRALDESGMYRTYVEVADAQHRAEFERPGVIAHVVGAACRSVGQAASGDPGAGANLLASMLHQGVVRPPAHSASAAALLAVRAARRAVKETPNDPDAHFSLSTTTLFLGDYQKTILYGNPRRPYVGFGRMLEEIRQVQEITALHQVLLLKPDFASAHEQIAELYFQLNAGHPNLPTHLDMALNHYYQWVQLTEEALTREIDRRPEVLGEMNREEFIKKRMNPKREGLRQRLRRYIVLKRQMQQLPAAPFDQEKLNDPVEFLSQLRAAYKLKAEGQSELNKARIALEYGLAEDALDILDHSDWGGNVTPEQVQFVPFLLLRSGQLEKARSMEMEKLQQKEGFGTENWFFILMALAAGDYHGADTYLADQQRRAEKDEVAGMLNFAHGSFLEVHSNPGFLRLAKRIAVARITRCNLLTLRGALALEQGDTAAAAQHFRTALGATERKGKNHAAAVGRMNEAAPAPFHFDLEALARAYLEALVQAQPRLAAERKAVAQAGPAVK